MKQVLDVLKAATMLAAIVFLAKGFFVLDHAQKSLVAVRADIHEIAGAVTSSTGKLNTALDDTHTLLQSANTAVSIAGDTAKQALETVNAAQRIAADAEPKITLALDRTNRLLLESDLTSKEIRQASVEQRENLKQIGERSLESLDKFNAATDAAKHAIQDMDIAVNHADTVINDPNIPSTFKHVDKMAADGEKVADRLAAPVNTVKRIAIFSWNSFLHFFGAR